MNYSINYLAPILSLVHLTGLAVKYDVHGEEPTLWKSDHVYWGSSNHEYQQLFDDPEVFDFRLYDVEESGGQWIAVGENNQAAISRDGISWTPLVIDRDLDLSKIPPGLYGSINNLKRVLNRDGIWLAVGNRMMEFFGTKYTRSQVLPLWKWIIPRDVGL